MKFGLQFLELTYLIYELCHVKKRKITFNSTEGEEKIKAEYIKNLENILGISKDEFEISLVKINSNSERTLN